MPPASGAGNVVYRLLVIYPNEASPRAKVVSPSAAEVLQAATALLAEHVGCERIVVMMEDTQLFAVDRSGNRLD